MLVLHHKLNVLTEIPPRVINAVTCRELRSSSIWSYPSRKSIFEKYFALLSSGNISSNFDI